MGADPGWAEEMIERKFIIYEDVTKEVVTALEAFIKHIDEDCAKSGCMCDLRGEVCSQHISDVLHHFESGLCIAEPQPVGIKKAKKK